MSEKVSPAAIEALISCHELPWHEQIAVFIALGGHIAEQNVNHFSDIISNVVFDEYLLYKEDEEPTENIDFSSAMSLICEKLNNLIKEDLETEDQLATLALLMNWDEEDE